MIGFLIGHIDTIKQKPRRRNEAVRGCIRSLAGKRDRGQEALDKRQAVLEYGKELEEGTLKGMKHGVHHDPKEYEHHDQSQSTK